MKKIIALLLVVALTAAVAVGGTLAYLTDRDSEVNTFTVGNVEIDLLEDYKQDGTLIPGVKIDKNAKIKNTGANDAWVWLTVLIPEKMGPYTAPDSMSAGNNVIHWNVPKDSANKLTIDFNEKPVSIDTDGDGTTESYYQTNLLWKNTLASNAETDIMFSTVYLDTHVDIDTDGNWYWVKDGGEVVDLNWNTETNGTPKIYVSAYAIQTNGFATVQDAYNAYQTQWGSNGAEYTAPTTAPSTEDGE